MEYIPKNEGLLKPEMVKEGDKLVIWSETTSTFSEKAQKTYWNCKVKLPDGAIKLAGLMDSTCDKMASKWGNLTEQWVGHSVQVSIKVSKKGANYLMLEPTDDAKIEVSAEGTGEVFPPEVDADKVNADDIPF